MDTAALCEFLLARIAEDEARARTGRDLRECEAKRRILDRCIRLSKTRDNQRAREVAVDFLTDLALPYADHPDYRHEWRQYR
jgi:hypothetical protein